MSAQGQETEGAEQKATELSNVYYSTFVSGLEEPVAQALRDASAGVEVREIHPGLILYASSSPPGRIKTLRFFRNSFLLLRRLEPPAEATVEEVLHGLAAAPQTAQALRRYGGSLRGTFRVMLQQGSRLISVEPRALGALEETVARATGLRVHRGGGDHELWLHLRTEGLTLFSWRVTQHPDFEKVLEKGELRPELVDVLCRLSAPRAGELFLDPFAGSGAIPIARATSFPRGLVLASDLDEERVQRLQERVGLLGLKKRVVVRRLDALAMSRYDDGCIDKIVTDPPWGLFRELGLAPADFYGRMLAECRRVLKPGGLLVVLMARDETFDAMVRSTPGLALSAELPILLSGRKAAIYKWVKSG